MREVRFDYKLRAKIFLMAVAFFGVGAGVMANVAATNKQGLIINRIIDFSPQSATMVYWLVAAVSLAFVILAVYLMANGMLTKRVIVITDDSITSPKSGLSNQYITIRFSDIIDINIQTIQKSKIIIIDHPGGRLSISNSMLPNNASFEKLVYQLQARMNF